MKTLKDRLSFKGAVKPLGQDAVPEAVSESQAHPGKQIFRPDMDYPFILKGGGRLREPIISYQTWGELSPQKDNAILLCHALTGGTSALEWWDGIVGEKKAIDTTKYFVVSSNVLGGCDGSTGPASLDPDSSGSWTKKLKPYGSRFPTITIRDMVRVQALLTKHLGISAWASVIGGSMGGMQALEWAVMYPDKVRSVAPLCSTLSATPWQIAFSSVGRKLIKTDPSWENGDYYNSLNKPLDSLALARALAIISYRSDEIFQARFQRDLVNPNRVYDLWDAFQVESYLDYQGELLAGRFDPNSYLILNKAMDLHDIGRNRGGIKKAATRIRVPVLALSVDSDLLYPVKLQKEMAGLINETGGTCSHTIIESPYGHDGFLLEVQKVSQAFEDFFEQYGI